jgi:ABC-2 type transport system permease protein
MIADAYRAEILKLVTLPASGVTVLAAWIVAAGLAAVPDADPIVYAQAGFVVLGVLAVTSEYSGGQVRTSLISVPRRVELMTAKALALTSASAPAAAVSLLLFRLVRPTAAAPGAASGIGYLTLVALLSAAVAALTRRSLPTLTLLLGWFFIATPLLGGHAPPAGRLSGPLVAGTLTALTAAAIAFRRRDS